MEGAGKQDSSLGLKKKSIWGVIVHLRGKRTRRKELKLTFVSRKKRNKGMLVDGFVGHLEGKGLAGSRPRP